MNLHDFLANLKADIDAKQGDVSYELNRTVSRSINATSHGSIMRTLTLDSLGYVLDVLVNQGTVEDLRELDEVLDNSSDLGPQPSHEEKIALLGELWNFSYVPEEPITGDEPLEATIDAWIWDVGRAAQSAIRNYVEANWEEPEDEDEEF